MASEDDISKTAKEQAAYLEKDGLSDMMDDDVEQFVGGARWDSWDDLKKATSLSVFRAAHLRLLKKHMYLKAFVAYVEAGGRKLQDNDVSVTYTLFAPMFFLIFNLFSIEQARNKNDPCMLHYFRIIQDQVIDDPEDPKSVKNRCKGEVTAGGMRNWAFHHLAPIQGFKGKGVQVTWSQPTQAFVRGGWDFGNKPYPPLPDWFLSAWEDTRQREVDEDDAEEVLDEVVRLYEAKHQNDKAEDDDIDESPPTPKTKRTKT